MLAQQQQQISREKAHQQQGLSPVTILSRYLLLGFLLVVPVCRPLSARPVHVRVGRHGVHCVHCPRRRGWTPARGAPPAGGGLMAAIAGIRHEAS
jgi:hypothetical protein